MGTNHQSSSSRPATTDRPLHHRQQLVAYLEPNHVGALLRCARIGARTVTPLSRLAASTLIVGVAFAACRDATMGVRTQFVGAYAFTPPERRLIARIAGDTTREVRQHLPALPAQITLRVQSGKDVIPETGESGTAMPPDWIVFIVDPEHPDGVTKIAEKHLRAALFHELHHLVRATTLPPHTLMDRIVFEGMATAFERDLAGANYPWGHYPGDVSKWIDDLNALPSDDSREEWVSSHPESRWLKYKVGTYLVDQAMKRVSRSSAELVSAPTHDILSITK